MTENDQQLLEAEIGIQTEALRQGLASEEQENWEDTVAQQEAIESEEANYANQLAYEQDQFQAMQEQKSALDSIKDSLSSPSILKYLLILLFFAVPNDIIDVLELTGLGLIVSWLVSLFLSAGSVLVTWLADGELQKVKAHQKNIHQYRQRVSAGLTKAAATVSRYLPRSPVGKILAGTILEMIPYLSILPWASICVLLAYNDERKMYKETVQDLESAYAELSTNPREMV